MYHVVRLPSEHRMHQIVRWGTWAISETVGMLVLREDLLFAKKIIQAQTTSSLSVMTTLRIFLSAPLPTVELFLLEFHPLYFVTDSRRQFGKRRGSYVSQFHSLGARRRAPRKVC